MRFANSWSWLLSDAERDKLINALTTKGADTLEYFDLQPVLLAQVKRTSSFN